MTSPKLTAWANAVKERDGKCTQCGSLEDLHAHHKMPKSSHPELKLDLDNGVTLCYRCHKAEHERNRPVRVRSGRPQRQTLITKIDQLTEENATLKSTIRKLNAFLGECNRGVCQSSTRRKRFMQSQ